MKMADETIEIEFHIGDTVVLEGKTKNAAYNLKQWGCNTYEMRRMNNDLIYDNISIHCGRYRNRHRHCQFCT